MMVIFLYIHFHSNVNNNAFVAIKLRLRPCPFTGKVLLFLLPLRCIEFFFFYHLKRDILICLSRGNEGDVSKTSREA